MSLLLNRAPRLFTFEEYYRLAEVGVLRPDERVELVEGEIVLKSPQDPKHARAISWCNNLFSQAFGETHLVRVQLPIRIGSKSELEPDLSLLLKSRAVALEEHPTTVDFVLEVANTSLKFDRGEKQRLYALASIPEYWIVNVRDRMVEVYRDPQGTKYADCFRRLPGEVLELLRLPGQPFPVTTLLGEPEP